MPRGKGREALERRRAKAQALRIAREARNTSEQLDVLNARLGPFTGAVSERQRLLYQLATRHNERAHTEMRDFAMMGRKSRR